MDDAILIAAAREYAKRKGHARQDYEVASLDRHDDKCLILFHGRRGLPGDHFTVELDAPTGKVTGFFPGE